MVQRSLQRIAPAGTGRGIRAHDVGRAEQQVRRTLRGRDLLAVELAEIGDVAALKLRQHVGVADQVVTGLGPRKAAEQSERVGRLPFLVDVLEGRLGFVRRVDAEQAQAAAVTPGGRERIRSPSWSWTCCSRSVTSCSLAGK